MEREYPVRCQFCKRDVLVPCKSTRDMDPVDGFNNDRVCHKELKRLFGGERGRK